MASCVPRRRTSVRAPAEGRRATFGHHQRAPPRRLTAFPSVMLFRAPRTAQPSTTSLSTTTGAQHRSVSEIRWMSVSSGGPLRALRPQHQRPLHELSLGPGDGLRRRPSADLRDDRERRRRERSARQGLAAAGDWRRVHAPLAEPRGAVPPAGPPTRRSPPLRTPLDRREHRACPAGRASRVTTPGRCARVSRSA